MFINDVLAGMVVILSALFTVIGCIGYIRYRIKAMLMTTIAFITFLAASLMYTLNSLQILSFNTTTLLLCSDIVILIFLYLTITVKG